MKHYTPEDVHRQYLERSPVLTIQVVADLINAAVKEAVESEREACGITAFNKLLGIDRRLGILVRNAISARGVKED